jgi:hypothetical protein
MARIVSRRQMTEDDLRRRFFSGFETFGAAALGSSILARGRRVAARPNQPAEKVDRP